MAKTTEYGVYGVKDYESSCKDGFLSRYSVEYFYYYSLNHGISHRDMDQMYKSFKSIVRSTNSCILLACAKST